MEQEAKMEKRSVFLVPFTLTQIAKIWSLFIFTCPFKKHGCKWFLYFSFLHTHTSAENKEFTFRSFFFFKKVTLKNPEQWFLRNTWEFLHLSVTLNYLPWGPACLPQYTSFSELPSVLVSSAHKKIELYHGHFLQTWLWITFDYFQKVNLPSRDEILTTQTVCKRMCELFIQ